ncbi:MAG: PrgI family protein [Firmicutes bacterium]|nr:PrgI family protein [Bacillota bacterium]
MPFVPVPKDLTKVKTKVALNLTKRQLICFGAAALVGLPTYFLARGALGNTVAVFLMIGLMLPFFFIAMYERDGQPAEKILRNFLRAKLWPGTRPYKTENLYKYLSMGGTPIAKQGKTATKTAARKRPAGTGK